MENETEKMVVYDYSGWNIFNSEQEYKIYARKTYNENTVLHRHTYIEFFYVTKGSGTHTLNNSVSTVKTGDACLLMENDTHGFTFDEYTDFHHIDILIKPEIFKETCDFFYNGLYDDILNEKFSRSCVLSFEQISRLNQFVSYLFLSPDNRKYISAAKFLLTSIIHFFLENHLRQTKDNPFPEWLISLLSKLNTNNNFSYPLTTLTAEYNYNLDYMRRIFKKYLGMTMTDYFNRRKLDYAYHLLQTTNFSVEQICEIVGFNNISHFYHSFKNVYNKKPSALRNSFQ